MDTGKLLKDVCLYICGGIALKVVLSLGAIPVMMLTGGDMKALAVLYWYMILCVVAVVCYAVYAIFKLGVRLGSGAYKVRKRVKSHDD